MKPLPPLPDEVTTGSHLIGVINMEDLAQYFVAIAGYQGTVIAIDLRYTKLDSEGNRVLIPNSKSFKVPITIMQ